MARTGAQRQTSLLPVVLGAQTVRAEAVLIIGGAAGHAVEGEFPFRFRQPHAAQIDLAVDPRPLRRPGVQRQIHREIDRSRAAGPQGGEDARVILLQRALPDQTEQSGRVGIGAGIDGERAPAEIGDGGLEFADAHIRQHRFAADGKTVADECDLGIHIGRGRPIVVELDAHVLQRGAGIEHAFGRRSGDRRERPVVEIARNHRAAVAHLAGDQCRVQPGDQGLRHRMPRPETLRRGRSGIVERCGKIDARPGAVALEPQAAAHIGAVTLAVDAQGGRFHPPAVARTPAHGFTAQTHHMGGAKTARPVEAHFRRGIERESQRIGISTQPAAQSADTRRVADRGELQIAHQGFRRHRTAAPPAHPHAFEHRTGLGRRQPAPQRRRQPVTQRHHRKQRAGIDAFGAQAVALAARQHQTIENLRLAVRLGMHLQALRIQPPAVRIGTPVRDRLQPREILGGRSSDRLRRAFADRTRLRIRKRRTAQPQRFQIAVDADRCHLMPAQRRPHFGAATALGNGHTADTQQR